MTGNSTGAGTATNGSSSILVQQAASAQPPEGSLRAAAATALAEKCERNPSMSESPAVAGNMHTNSSGNNLQGLMSLQWRGSAAYDPLFVMPYGAMMPSARFSGCVSPPGTVAILPTPSHANSGQFHFQGRCGSFSDTFPGSSFTTQRQPQQAGPLLDTLGNPVDEGAMGEPPLLVGTENSECQRIGVLGAFNSFDEVETYAE